MAFRYKPFTENQLKLLTWWMPESPFNKANGIIASGAVRAGKTVIMALSFVMWATSVSKGKNYAICGKTVSSTRRNVITPLKQMLKLRGYKVIDKLSEGLLKIAKNGNVNTFFVFGGRDESSASLIQGVTLAGIMLDEVALMPKSFVEQAIARCSEEGSKYWYNCNPEGPRHWFKMEHVDEAEDKGYLLLHFTLFDNPSLSKETIDKYYSMFKGIFFRRFILGEWAFADGVIYSDIPSTAFYTSEERQAVLPIKVQERDIKPFYAADYGTTNPQVFLEMYKIEVPGEAPHFFVENEYYWDSKKRYKQKSDAEYVVDFKQFSSEGSYRYLIIDPSAESLYVACQKAGIKVLKAKNEVRRGISLVAMLFNTGRIHINKENCPNLVAELGLYIWDEKKAERGIEEPVKKHDHCCDALRYGVMTTTNAAQILGFNR